ncbi:MULTISPECIES: MerR family transcriptional regulator [Streptomyces]|uniref:MerR family transcriptional regulator n=1 Tax=Streptomyces TaxID=1883 RepID=UPI0039B721A4
MRIGELASRAGVSVRSVRYYEEQGLLTSVRSPSGQRHYTEDQVERVGFIQRMYTAGLSSRTILELMPCVDAPSMDNSDAALERMTQERERLSRHIEQLVETRDSLDRLVAVATAYRELLHARSEPVSPDRPNSCAPEAARGRGPESSQAPAESTHA